MSNSHMRPASVALAPDDFPHAIALHAIYKRNFAGAGTADSPYVGGWVVDGRSLGNDAEANAWLRSHGFHARGRRWYRQDMTLGGFLQLRAWARSAVGASEPILSRTPGAWKLRRTSIVSAQDDDIEIAQVLTDDEIDADGNLMGRGLADGKVLAAAPMMLTTLETLASDERVPADLRGYARHVVAVATGTDKPGTIESVRKKTSFA
ncbi:hypothetical protein [Variovorax sp. DXTD-1]|uniref:hypothetical protein n=1 Tax=Variovorax sp. DXTD-1 TaxID=2495592 RepID=UPI000F879CC3|nr:hypothetical protein [Variovorax sp. DXTD-1]RST45373.1 hypothetical protein EJI00_23930 [Variovorax sp. DXTD-1]